MVSPERLILDKKIGLIKIMLKKVEKLKGKLMLMD